MLYFFTFLSFSSVKLSHMNALLPFRSDRSKNLPSFEIQNFGDSCVSWSSSNPSIIRVTPIGNSKCPKSAKVEVLYYGPNRLNTLIFAETKDGNKYSCNVYTDKISKIEILTSTRTIYAETLPQQISLQGFDSKQNIFTTIGETCEWNYDTKYFSLDKSTSQKNSISISLYGKKTGKSMIKAKLGNLESRVEISIVEQISLLPSGYIKALPGVKIPFTLCSSLNEKGECRKKTDLKSGHYTFKSQDSDVASIGRNGEVQTNKVGVSTISASDSLSDDNVASTVINVTLPASAYQEKQYVLKGQTAVFNPKVYDEFGNELFGGNQIKWTIIDDYPNIGDNVVRLSYYSFTFSAIVVVCSPITTSPEVAVLPIQSEYLSVAVVGGSGFFSYKVLDRDLCENNDDNKIRGLNKLGETFLMIYDQKIPSLSARTKVIVSKLKTIQIELNERELYVGGFFKPKCRFISQVGLNFSVQIQHEIVSTNVIVVPFSLEAKSEGFSTIYCHVKDIRSEEIRVSVINKLSYSFSGRASPNSHIPLHYTGGPLKWDGQSPPKVEIICGGTNVKVFKNSYTVDNEFSGSCSLNIQNKASNVNPYPILSTYSFDINVSNVKSLRITPVDPQASVHDNCNPVPRQLKMEWKPIYNAVPNHVHEFYAFAFDKADNVINYYSANHITFTVDGMLVERISYDETIGASIYKAMIQKSSDVTAQTENAYDYSFILNVINPIVVESNKMIYYHKNMETSFSINGGSGFFNVQGPNSRATNTSIIVRPQSVGHFTYYISDMCTDQESVSTELDVVTIKRLNINAPDVAIINSNVLITVEAFSESGKQIDASLIEKAEISLSSPPAVKQSPNTWLYTPTSLGNKTISATAINSIRSSKVINVIPPITANPDNIVILPKDSVTIDVAGPSNLELESNDPSIVKVIGYSVIGISPGNTTVRVFIPSEPSVEPYNINVRVLNPIEITFIQTPQTIIEGGIATISLQVITDGGVFPVSSADWKIHRDIAYKQQNSSFIIMQDLKAGSFEVSVTAYNLFTKKNINVEPKFVLNVPQTVILPPGGSLTVTATSEIPFTLTSNDQSIISINGREIISNGQQGIAFITATTDLQVTSFAVNVVPPGALIFNRTSSFMFCAILIDTYGRSYTSLQGVRFSTRGTGFNAGAFNPDGTVQIGATTNETITIIVNAKTHYMDISTSVSLIMLPHISPKEPVILQGATVPFFCSSGNVRWELTDSKIGYITPTGVFSALSTGKATLICDKSTTTPISVVAMKEMKIEKKAPDQFQVIPVYNENVSNSFVQKPSDFMFRCSWDSNKCGLVKSISNISGYFCIVERVSHHKCPEYSQLHATFSSNIAKVMVTETSRIPFVGLVDFGIPNEHVVNMSSSTRKVTIPLSFGANELKYECAKGWSVSFQNNDAVIRAPKSFKGEEVISFTHIESGEKIKTIFKMVDDDDDEYSPVIHQRDAATGKAVSIIIAIIAFVILGSLALLYKGAI